jgi:hypothetical protein
MLKFFWSSIFLYFRVLISISSVASLAAAQQEDLLIPVLASIPKNWYASTTSFFVTSFGF